jgi:hypothetical protein
MVMTTVGSDPRGQGIALIIGVEEFLRHGLHVGAIIFLLGAGTRSGAAGGGLAALLADGQGGGVERVGHVGMDHQAAGIINAGAGGQQDRNAGQGQGQGNIAARRLQEGAQARTQIGQHPRSVSMPL